MLETALAVKIFRLDGREVLYFQITSFNYNKVFNKKIIFLLLRQYVAHVQIFK